MERIGRLKVINTASRKKSFYTSFNKYKYLYILLLPGIIYFLVYKYIPMFGVIIAFKNFYVGLGFIKSEWVGFKHFERLFSSYYFFNILRNTILISVYRIIFGFPMPILLALSLNEVKNRKFKSIIQTVSYLPHFVSWIIVAGIIYELLSPTTGVFNQILKFFGMDTIYFLADPRYFRSILVISGIWTNIGWGSIIYLAAISGIDPQMYEAAIIDGANRLQQTIYITLPGLLPIISIMLVLRIGNILDESFDQIYNLYSPSVYKVADVFETYTYREGLLNASYSYASAVGFFKSFVGLILVTLANRFAKHIGQVGIW